MRVEVRTHEASVPRIFENVAATYTKGVLYCISTADMLVVKIPVQNIFDIKEIPQSLYPDKRED